MKKINEVSRITGVTKRTLQYYDDEGILPIERTPNNYRVYDQYALEQIWQILIYKEMDFKLNEIKHLLNLSEEQKEQYFNRQMEKIQEKIVSKEVQLKFISLVQNSGLPMRPGENGEKTYLMQMKELREKMREEITEGKKKNEIR